MGLGCGGGIEWSGGGGGEGGCINSILMERICLGMHRVRNPPDLLAGTVGPSTSLLTGEGTAPRVPSWPRYIKK